jgi:hypothetical protein
MPWQPDIRMRDYDSLKFGVVEIFCMAAFDKASTVAPLSIHREDEPSGGRCNVRLRAAFRERIGSEGGSRDECAGLF